MPDSARERVAELLGGLAEPAASSAYCKLFMSDLSVTVDGIGKLAFPVSEEQSARLRGLGRRAPFGRREETLTDLDVRDTWEIPRDLVHPEWSGRFEAALELVRDELGLPPHCELTPELHSMLLYEPGQFFVTHQDSEKDDTMVGTLVVTLPSEHTGGELVIEHRGETTEYRGSAVAVSLVAFYADCHHQVLPVKAGNRITLTYNLMLKGDTGAAPQSAMVGELATALDEHFSTPIILSYGRGKADPPTRLAYLLDHEYTARGLSWSRLKGSDADRAALLRAAADQAGCDVALALADIQETWDALDADDADPWDDYGRGYHDDDEYDDDDDFDDDEEYEEEEEEEEDDDDDDDEEDSGADRGRYLLQDLIDSTITLSHWIGPGADQPEEITLNLRDTEVSATTASADLKPYTSQYEGYMGNYGNTLDRWYRRAAVVVWPRGKDFANRAQASSAWALEEITRLAHAGKAAEAREATQTLSDLWDARDGYRIRPGGDLLGAALRTAGAVDDADAAAMLLRPFQLHQLTPDQAPALTALAAGHGHAWTDGQLRGWSESWRPQSYAHPPELTEWLVGLPQLCEALRAEGDAGGDAGAAVTEGGAGPAGASTARRIVDLAWNWFSGMVGPSLTGPSTGSLDEWLSGLGLSLAGILTAALQTGSTAVLDEAVKLVRTRGDQVTVLVMAALRAADSAGHGRVRSPGEPDGFGDTGDPGGLDALAAGCAERLRTSLARPRRADDDWSIEPPAGCTCELCRPLGEFLRSPQRRTFEWPLAQAKRAHIHSRIDTAELPVRHQTRRQGRPYTLVLTKTTALFERELDARRRAEEDLAWLTQDHKPLP